MDPNNNQQSPISPLPQTIPMPPAQAVTSPVVSPPASASMQASIPPEPIQQSSAVPPSPKKGQKKGILLILLILLLIIAGAVYILFTNNQSNTARNVPAENNSIALPTPTAVPTVLSEDNLDIENPEADLNDLNADVGTL
ncbi:MAG: hypothetical protein A3H79_01595 [Candidatus Levybacteria bacterium RIFCSPLOWO2_02_FULL_36_8b]|uniref:Uncharacterized protein n=1 Tax=candidate division WWE3 bacterium RIFCSPHIGHO2_01_FULL_35_17 TaxID=1802614 RepID=A0A1F4UPC9_UNCKA|nr:MAG: hypothetical protein A2713_01325 [candidate division WWE3 bacterium RIFCSPHIGHO2_01_FULL_35_17]OGH42253.1 MAG: hypothetical protein A3H79_01595 [Candidatus Levybacteria bacterium RIFCSPLOWO2_02_FULL_36_8b]